MSPLTVRMKFSPEQAQRFLQEMGRDLPQVIAAGVRASLAWATADVTTNRMLGQYINRRTGTAIRSITASPRIDLVTKIGVRGIWGSHLGYVMAHEQGFEGPVTVREYTRRKFRTRGATGKRLKRRVLVEGVAIRVRQHVRQMRIRARYFMRDTMREGQSPTERRLIEAMRIRVRTGRIPRWQDLRSV